MHKQFKLFPQLALIISSIACLVVLPVGAIEQTPQTNPTTQTESIFFTAVDGTHHSITSLKAEDVRIFAGNKECTIVSLQQLADQPTAVAILIDNSRSQEKTLPKQKMAADIFVKEIMHSGKEQVAIISFTGQATIEQNLTNDLELVRSGIARVQLMPLPGYVGGGVVVGRTTPVSKDSDIVNGSTALWDAIWATSEKVLSPAQASRAIILLSDGNDTYSKIKVSEAIARAIKADIAVYSIGIGNTEFGEIDTAALRKLSDQTGGRAFFPKKEKDLDAVFTEIEQDLRSQYQVTYRTDVIRIDKPQKVRLEISNPALRGKDVHVSYQRLNVPR